MFFMLKEINNLIEENKDYIEEKITPGSILATSGIFGFLTANSALEYIKNNWTSLATPVGIVKVTGFIANIFKGAFSGGAASELKEFNIPIDTGTITYIVKSIQAMSGIVAIYGIGKMLFYFVEKLRDYNAESERIKISLKNSKLTNAQLEKYNQLTKEVETAGFKAKQEIEELSVNTKKLKLEIDELEARQDDLSFKELKDLEEKRKKLVAHGVMLKKLEDVTNATN